MTGVEAQTMLKTFGSTIPALREVAEDDRLLNPAIHPKHYNYFKEVLPYARPLIGFQLGESQILELCGELDLLWANLEGAEEACARIEARFNEQYFDSQA
ncbi:hypothetical protein [Cohnella rhizosphaerae]|uniref:Uncharacterized protein n=1 Tax=Cohnella rhizosphaerae TaxID=1457232 RepID=A0A9X4KYG3_9BACL|nr:hypothetical protein [Cohnella rhizosphaerae]MDG0813555.1 hypothetical protein [Cohnella rhizosphaerae]